MIYKKIKMISSANFKKLLSNLPEGVYVVNINTVNSYYNQRYRVLFSNNMVCVISRDSYNILVERFSNY